jgi:hypothetical protein
LISTTSKNRVIMFSMSAVFIGIVTGVFLALAVTFLATLLGFFAGFLVAMTLWAVDVMDAEPEPGKKVT